MRGDGGPKLFQLGHAQATVPHSVAVFGAIAGLCCGIAGAALRDARAMSQPQQESEPTIGNRVEKRQAVEVAELAR